MTDKARIPITLFVVVGLDDVINWILFPLVGNRSRVRKYNPSTLFLVLGRVWIHSQPMQITKKPIKPM